MKFPNYLRSIFRSFLSAKTYLMPNARQQRFLSAVEKLNLRFPVADIARDTGFAQSTVSQYLASREVSDTFLRKFCEVYKIDFAAVDSGAEKRKEGKPYHVEHDGEAISTINDQGPAIKDEGSLKILIESNRLLAESQKVFAESQKIFAQSQLNFSESNKRVIDTNSVLAQMLQSKFTEPGLQAVPLDVLTTMSGMMEYLVEVGLDLKKWPDAETGVEELNRRFYAPQKVGATTNNP